MTEQEIDFIDIAKCRNCKNYFVKNGIGYCKQRPDGKVVLVDGKLKDIGWEKTDSEDSCSLFDETENKVDKKKKKEYNILTRRGQIENFWDKQPFFYDKSKIFWLWDFDEKKWDKSDEVDFLNSIQKHLQIDTLNSKVKNEIIEGFKQIGRLHKPSKFKKSWIQFKSKIYDIENGEQFESTPEYFSKNSIPFEVGKSEETPTIDNLFTEWVGEKHRKELEELSAYSLSSDQFMQRVFALCGGGSNGKGTFIKFLDKFIGENNIVSSELKNLSEDKFEPAILFGKLLVVMGEVSYGDLRNTNLIKKLSGEDKLSYQFKGKTPFTEENSATGICLTNSLPITPDKSIGFYRKWHIIDFPNQFNQVKKDLIGSIPEIEFQNFAKKSLRILKELNESRKFTNEGDFDERIKKYEEHSNPVMRFVEEFCEEKEGKNTPIRIFANKCNEHFKEKHLRVMTVRQISKILKEEGFEVGKRHFEGISSVVILNLHIDITKTLKTTNILN